VGGGGSVEDEDDDEQLVPEHAVIAHGLTPQLWALHELDDVQQPVQQLPQVGLEQPSTLVVEQFEHVGWPHDCTWHECTLHDCALQLCWLQLAVAPVPLPGPSTATSAPQPGASARAVPTRESRIKPISDFMRTPHGGA
jgi:hypothetical protein